MLFRSYENEGREYIIEIKSVNNRFTDINIKMPRNLNYLEEKIIKQILSNISSEKFDVTLNVTNGTSNNNTLKVVSGDNAIFTITASDGYALDIESQTCEGTLDSNTGIYTINNITENKECNHTIDM